MATAVRSLSRWERAGVRGYGLSLVEHPSPDLLRKSTSPRRGEANKTVDRPIQSKIISLWQKTVIARNSVITREKRVIQYSRGVGDKWRGRGVLDRPVKPTTVFTHLTG